MNEEIGCNILYLFVTTIMRIRIMMGKGTNVVSLLFGTGKPPSRDINSHNSHSTSFQIGDYECVSCCELMSWVVCSVSNKSEITILFRVSSSIQ
jgi:hypothetical protein